MQADSNTLSYPKNTCLVCGHNITLHHVGTACIGGLKSNSAEESIKIPSISLDLEYCPSCNFTAYRKLPEAVRLLESMYENQHSTYALLQETDTYLVDLAKVLSETTPDLGGLVLEIGCNDGALLSEFKNKFGRKTLGIEPGQNFDQIWEQRGLEISNCFFDKALSQELQSKQFDIIIVRHVLEHISNPVEFIKNITLLMGPKTKLVIESPYLPTVINYNRFENISYAHLNHFTARSINQIVKQYGMGINSFRRVDTDGGSFVATILPNMTTPNNILDSVSEIDLTLFCERLALNGQRVLEKLKAYGPGEVIGFGAGAKGPHLVSLYQLDTFLTSVVDNNKAFHGQYLAGTKIKIVSPDNLMNKNLKAVLNLAPTHIERIREQIPISLEIIEII